MGKYRPISLQGGILDHKEAVSVLNAVLNFYPDSYQDEGLPTVIIHDGEQYRIGISIAPNPVSEMHRWLVLELLFDSMPFFRLTRATKKAISKLSKQTWKDSDIDVSVGQDAVGFVTCLIKRTYGYPAETQQIHQDNAKISALAMVVFQVISSSQ